VGNFPLPISTFNPSDIVTNKESLSDTVTPAIVLQNNRDYVVGTIQYNCFWGEITALGSIKTLNQETSFHYCGINAASWKALYSKENQCTFSLADKKTSEISFFVDSVK